MDFQLTDDQKMIQETAASFVKKDSPVERTRKLRDSDLGYDAAVWKQMGELGWLGLPLPEAVGGFGGTMIDASLLLEQFGTTLVPEPYLPSVVLGGMAVAHGADEAQQKELLGPMVEGDTSLALAWTEREGRYAATHVTTKAEKAGDGWTLRGEKTWVLNGHAADHLIVSARTGGSTGDREGVSLFAVAKDADGLTVRPVKTMDGGRAATVTLEGAEARLLGEEGGAGPVLELVLDKAAAAACAEGLGIAQTVLWMTVEYLKTRKQFGVPIGVFQALQHRAVDMFVQVELLKGTSILANARVDEDDVVARQRAVSAAKARLTTGGFHVVAQGTQLHGGIGVTDEHDISLYFKRMRVLNGLFGDEETHVRRFMWLPEFTAGV
ncbi:MAG TPA: acyl-CoA dehydrogenase family protein [Sandaracinaceae bacterium LLY-WYZ-13_1]|nr:acyl-CoA dehydrogenase family protein [Sandaracinaceae bacterium LLY-WYZ-13_1]